MYSKMVTAIAEMFSKLFQWRSVETERQSESELIKDKKDYKKATDVAERIFVITDKYLSKMNPYHAWLYERRCKLFRKYN